MELQGAGGYGTGITLHKCSRASFELPKTWDLTGTPDDAWLGNKLSTLGQQPITWTLSDAHGSFERVEGFVQQWQPQLDGRINIQIQWTGAVYNYGILRAD